MGTNKDISKKAKEEIIQWLMLTCRNGKPGHGKMKEASEHFQICLHSISLIWNKAKAQTRCGEVINPVSKRSTRITKKKHEIDYEKIQQIDVHKRNTVQRMSDELKIPKSVVGRWATGHLLRPHTNAIKPLLTAPNMLSRLSFSLEAIHLDAASNSFKFKDMENTIHIDEKWFYLSRKSCRFYLTPMEADPLRVTQSKNFIPKVMFMVAVSRPVYDCNRECIFDGKIRVWPFVEEVTAQRNSKKRQKGTKELNPIQSITREVIKKCIIQQIVPAIKEKWPSCLSKDINIQQDNARTHIKCNDADFLTVAKADDFDIKIVQQPANSPDCNVLDLGFFSAIQSLQQRIRCKDADDLIKAVETSFSELQPMTLNKVFLSLQCVMVEIMKIHGSNNYKGIHMKKNNLIRQGTLPNNLGVSLDLVRECIDYLIGEDYTGGIQELMGVMGITAPYNGEGIPDLNMCGNSVSYIGNGHADGK